MAFGCLKMIHLRVLFKTFSGGRAPPPLSGLHRPNLLQIVSCAPAFSPSPSQLMIILIFHTKNIFICMRITGVHKGEIYGAREIVIQILRMALILSYLLYLRATTV